MSNEAGNLVKVEKNPEDQELSLEDDLFIQYLEKNLAMVLADTEQKTAELEKLQKLKKQLSDHLYHCLETARKKPFPEGMNLLPRLSQVSSKAEDLVGLLTALIDAKANVDKAYNEHCNKAKSFTKEQLKSRYDKYTTTPTRELEKIIRETREALKQTLDKTAAKKAELTTKKKEYQAKHSAIIQEIEALTVVEQDAVEQLEQLRLEAALGKQESSD